MKIEVIPYSMDNYGYLIICEESGLAAAVDPGEGYPFLQAVEKNRVKLAAVLCTHHHADHVGNLEMLIKENSEVNVYCHETDSRRIQLANTYLNDGDIFQLGEIEISLLHTPGHTAGSVVYGVEGSIFVGDTLFGGGCGRLFEGTPEQMFTSLQKIRSQFSDEVLVYFGHEYTRTNMEFALLVDEKNEQVVKRLARTLDEFGNKQVTTPSTLSLEYQTNPFLRTSAINVENCSTPLEVFTYLRKMRNRF
jgi:hydroxyacylglutathione hydrolase